MSERATVSPAPPDTLEALLASGEGAAAEADRHIIRLSEVANRYAALARAGGPAGELAAARLLVEAQGGRVSQALTQARAAVLAVDRVALPLHTRAVALEGRGAELARVAEEILVRALAPAVSRYDVSLEGFSYDDAAPQS